MPLVISDEMLESAKLTEQELRVEIACRLYDARRIGKGMAARFAGLTRSQLEDELVKRGLPVIRYTEEMWAEDLKALETLNEKRRSGR